MENNHIDWEVSPSQDFQTDMKAIRKQLRKRSQKIVLISLALAAALLLLTVFVGIPAAEKCYWDPNVNSYDTEYATDLDLTLVAYSELFFPESQVIQVETQKTGFASYSIDVLSQDLTVGDRSHRYLMLEKGSLRIPSDFGDTAYYGSFQPLEEPYFSAIRTGLKDTLAPLPDYITISTRIAFSADMTMQELAQFQYRLRLLGGDMQWATIRHKDSYEIDDTLCGIKVVFPRIYLNGINDDYPSFDAGTQVGTGSTLEDHFLALLRYSNDQYQSGTGIASPAAPYDEMLAYMEENGVYSFGCYATASPSAVLELLEWPEIAHIYLYEGWVDIH